MTVYNTCAYLPLAIESILQQTFSDFEFIIVDDGSTDGSGAIAQRYADRDPRIQLLQRPNRGIVAAANEGIDIARGRYVARMDSDDISLPQRLQQQIAYLDEHPECVLVGAGVMMVDPHGSPVGQMDLKLTHEEIEEQLLSSAGGTALIQPAVMIRIDALRAVGAYRGTSNIAEDMDLFLRLAERGRVVNLPDVLLQYRRHPKSVSQTQHDQQVVMDQIVREAMTRRGRTVPPDWKLPRWEPLPPQRQFQIWGWAALKLGNVKVARKHAWAALRTSPVSLENWRLLYCCLRGR
jgi:glycosyltransferase involved in cell wall biosynthesis